MEAVRRLVARMLAMSAVVSRFSRWVARAPRVPDVSLDHADVASGLYAEVPVSADEDPLVGEGLRLECATRAELAARLGGLAEMVDSRQPKKRRHWSGARLALEARFADACGRCARDACLVAASARCARARKARRQRPTGRRLARLDARLDAELRPLLASAGALESLLLTARGGGAEDREWVGRVLAAAAEAVGCAPPSQHADRAAFARAIAGRAEALRTQKAFDEDARALRRRARRKIARRLVVLVAAWRCVAWVRRVVDEYGGISAIARDARSATGDIVSRRLVVPATAIKDDLLLNKRGKGISDPRALADARATLEAMLDDWLDDVAPRGVGEAERRQRAKDHDMSTVNDVFVREVRSAVRNLLSGRIARALLIQLQFVTKEVYQAMAAIDDILAQNQAIIQVLALFPGIFLVAAVFRLLKNIFIALVSESVKSTETVRGEMAAVLAEAARVVHVAPSPPDEPLDPLSVGALALHVHTLRDRAYRERARFSPARLARLDRALRDLFTPGLTRAHIKDLLTLVLWDHDFLRLSDARVVPAPMNVLQPRLEYKKKSSSTTAARR
ncbi:hypothetical protein CTAYLR_007564 [Chrysophaeum taylorii]|uniref:Uncharacterized protein n=1 Tax=Chrysophaeum taylorii TaxID=2483200 RepID=A0AAD7UFS0_9STRA|nr:hypothetical protein CTAYLR_007564 [Chrysophaeum taylorii]